MSSPLSLPPNRMLNSRKRKSLSQDSHGEKRKKPTTTHERKSLSPKESQNTTKRKSLSEDPKGEKRKKRKKATNSRQRRSLSQNHGDDEKRRKRKKSVFRFFTKTPTSRCDICLDSVKRRKIFKIPLCNHPFCTKCISKYVKLQRKEKAVRMYCPGYGCLSELKPEQLQSILPKELIAEWEYAIYEFSIPMNKKIYCPYENCSVMMVNDGVEVVTSCECPSCHRLFCAKCKVPWHEDMSCRRFQKSAKCRDEKQMDEKFLELAKKEKWQRCPGCSMHVEKNGGCNTISCRCGRAFTWSRL